MNPQPTVPLTARQIAARRGCTVNRVLYAIRSRSVGASSVVGHIRLFGPAEVVRIVDAVDEASRRTAPGRSRVAGGAGQHQGGHT